MNIDLLTGSGVAADIIDTINQMFKKGLLPERSRKLIYDSVPQMTSQYMIQVWKEWSCSDCQITVSGPKFLMIQHQKVHADEKEMKENEIMKKEFKIY